MKKATLLGFAGLLLIVSSMSGAQSDDALIQSLRSPDPNVRIAAIDAPGFLPSVLTADIFVKALKDRDPFVRVAATRAIFEMGDEGVRRILSAFVKDPGAERTLAEALILGPTIRPADALPIAPELNDEIRRVTAFLRCDEQLCVQTLRLPVYPPLARLAHLTGQVSATLDLDGSGQVTAVRSKGNNFLRPAAEEALRKWTFEFRGNIGRPTTHEVVVDFEIRGNRQDLGGLAVDFKLPDYVHFIVRPAIVSER